MLLVALRFQSPNMFADQAAPRWIQNILQHPAFRSSPSCWHVQTGGAHNHDVETGVQFAPKLQISWQHFMTVVTDLYRCIHGFKGPEREWPKGANRYRYHDPSCVFTCWHLETSEANRSLRVCSPSPCPIVSSSLWLAKQDRLAMHQV